MKPNAILSRSNAGVIENVVLCLREGIRCAVLDGTKELQRVLTDVQRVKQGEVVASAELVGFASWAEVMRFSVQPEGEGLRALVNLVQEQGEQRMLRALSACEADESSADVVCSTMHRAKGREWPFVHLDQDSAAGFERAARLPADQSAATMRSEARLLYVAMTRAKLGLRLPPDIGKRFVIRNTTTDILG